jgi:glutamine synthetase type III
MNKWFYVTKCITLIAAYNPTKKAVNFGADAIGELMVPTEDRNRTSPFPYGGGRFEFRAVGSTQNCSMVNTVSCFWTAMNSSLPPWGEGGSRIYATFVLA